MFLVKLPHAAVMLTLLLFLGCFALKEITCQSWIGLSTMKVMSAYLCNSPTKIKAVALCSFCMSLEPLGYMLKKILEAIGD